MKATVAVILCVVMLFTSSNATSPEVSTVGLSTNQDTSLTTESPTTEPSTTESSTTESSTTESSTTLEPTTTEPTTGTTVPQPSSFVPLTSALLVYGAAVIRAL